MRLSTDDLWAPGPYDARVITTNGTVTARGLAVMGRGCARQARDQIPGIDRVLGQLLRTYGNRPLILQREPFVLCSFPVKHRWQEAANLILIRESAAALVELANAEGWRQVLLPRPGCGNGWLSWRDVAPVLAPILDDRFVVTSGGAVEPRGEPD